MRSNLLAKPEGAEMCHVVFVNELYWLLRRLWRIRHFHVDFILYSLHFVIVYIKEVAALKGPALYDFRNQLGVLYNLQKRQLTVSWISGNNFSCPNTELHLGMYFHQEKKKASMTKH